MDQSALEGKNNLRGLHSFPEIIEKMSLNSQAMCCSALHG